MSQRRKKGLGQPALLQPSAGAAEQTVDEVTRELDEALEPSASNTVPQPPNTAEQSVDELTRDLGEYVRLSTPKTEPLLGLVAARERKIRKAMSQRKKASFRIAPVLSPPNADEQFEDELARELDKYLGISAPNTESQPGLVVAPGRKIRKAMSQRQKAGTASPTPPLTGMAEVSEDELMRMLKEGLGYNTHLEKQEGERAAEDLDEEPGVEYGEKKKEGGNKKTKDREPKEPKVDIHDKNSSVSTDRPSFGSFESRDSPEGSNKRPKELKGNKDHQKEVELSSPHDKGSNVSEGEKNSPGGPQRTTSNTPTSTDVQLSILSSTKTPVASPKPSHSPPPLAPQQKEKMVPSHNQEPIWQERSPPSHIDNSPSENPLIIPDAQLLELQDAIDSELLDDSAVMNREKYQQAMKSKSELDRDPPLVYPFKHFDIYKEYFPNQGNMYKPGQYLGPPGPDRNLPRMEFLTFYYPESSRDILDTRPQRPSSASDTYQPLKDILREVGDDGWEERLADRLDKHDWDYLEDLSERMFEERKKRGIARAKAARSRAPSPDSSRIMFPRILPSDEFAIPGPDEDLFLRDRREPKVNQEDDEDGMEQKRKEKEQGQKEKEHQIQVEKKRRQKEREQQIQAEAERKEREQDQRRQEEMQQQQRERDREIDEELERRRQAELEMQSESRTKRQQEHQRRLQREADEVERKQALEREPKSRQIDDTEERRGKEQREEFEGRSCEFYIVKDGQKNLRWVVADKSVEISENLVYIDKSAYNFVYKVSPNPHPEYKDPRDQYTSNNRPYSGSYPCDKERTCACFGQNLEHPTTALFNTGDGRGIGLRALRDINEGDYIGEFRGDIEIRNNNEKREKLLYKYENMDMRYAAGGHWNEYTNFGVDEIGNERSFSYYIDAKYAGNETRFINHHCDPNHVNCEYFQENHKGRMYLTIRAIRDIPKGQEILLDYGTMNDWTVHSRTCLCASERCRYLAILNKSLRETYTVRIIDEDGDNPRDVLVVPNSVEEPFITKPVIKAGKKMKPYWVRYEIDNINKEDNKLDWPSEVIVHVVHHKPRVKEKKINKFDELTRRTASRGRMIERLADLYAERAAAKLARRRADREEP